ncbi:transposase [bacterium]|nr:MAG: transposase [bacterium]QQR62321.1 MAG: transposase [bacterium]QQR63398.1 MAG: transposase [bacterium]
MAYLDESGFCKSVLRTHGCSKKGSRCHGSYDWGAKARTNAIAALIGSSLITATLFECSIDSTLFYHFIVDELLPKLSSKTVIVMDNAAFHKVKGIQDVIKQAGHILLFLPPYSPDLNPIEHKWAQLKSLRKESGNSVYDLFKQNISINAF